jgi:hypothetical protein
MWKRKKFFKQLFRNGVKELIMIEMQGNFEIKGNIAAQKLGNFIWHENGTATLAIGHQLFEGKLVSSKFFLLIYRCSR